MIPRKKITQIIFLILLSTGSAIAQNQIINQDSGVKKIANIVNQAAGEDKLISNQINSGDISIKKDSPTQANINGALKNSNSANSHKNNSSLMYSDDELKKIQEAINALKDGKPLNSDAIQEDITPEDNAKSYIYLGSILYNSPNSWSAWINDQKISSTDNKIGNELYIKSINADSVRVIWTMSISKWKILTNKKSEDGAPINQNNQVEIDFTLSFNQTYMLNGSRIVEGRIAPLLNSSLSKTANTIPSKNTN
ncbi:MAG: hypothetical protein V4612_01820 [Pseudomonadota bacterium]